MKNIVPQRRGFMLQQAQARLPGGSDGMLGADVHGLPTLHHGIALHLRADLLAHERTTAITPSRQQHCSVRLALPSRFSTVASTELTATLASTLCSSAGFSPLRDRNRAGT